MVDDDAVWKAYEAAQAEAECWRVMSWPSQGAFAIRDISPTPLPSHTPVEVNAREVKFERIDFKDGAQARSYIEWRSIKAALETLEGQTRG